MVLYCIEFFGYICILWFIDGSDLVAALSCQIYKTHVYYNIFLLQLVLICQDDESRLSNSFKSKSIKSSVFWPPFDSYGSLLWLDAEEINMCHKNQLMSFFLKNAEQHYCDYLALKWCFTYQSLKHDHIKVYILMLMLIFSTFTWTEKTFVFFLWPWSAQHQQVQGYNLQHHLQVH